MCCLCIFCFTFWTDSLCFIIASCNFIYISMPYLTYSNLASVAIDLDILLHIKSTCGFQSRFSCIKTPRNFVVTTRSKAIWFSVIENVLGGILPFLWNMMKFVFDAFKASLLLLNQLLIFKRSSLIISISSSYESAVYMALVSSANSIVVAFEALGKSLM